MEGLGLGSLGLLAECVLQNETRLWLVGNSRAKLDIGIYSTSFHETRGDSVVVERKQPGNTG